MTGEARLLAFESWMDAALRGDNWLGPLRKSAELLGARTAAIVWCGAHDSATVLNASPDAAPQFLRLCSALADVRAVGVFERDEPGLGRLVWTKVQADASPEAGELTFLALFDGLADATLLREIAAAAAAGVAASARLTGIHARSALKTAALDQLPFGVVIVDRQGRIAERNEACRRILARSDGLSALQDKLLCREHGAQAALCRAVNRALSGDSNASIVKVRRTRGAEPYVVRVVAPRGAAREHCLLMIVDPDEEPVPGSDIWRMMFDLTDCELIIAEGLVSGRRINDIASQRGVSIETVRTQTKRMFERLNVSSQAEAAARLSRTAPFRPARCVIEAA